jgi:SOS-response transcriptional repressor LexA
VWLLPENEAFSPIDGREAVLLGVVRGVVREYD